MTHVRHVTQVLRALGVLAVVGSLLAAALPVVAHSPDPAIGSAMTQSGTITYKWASGGTPPTDMRAAIHAARADSNESNKSKAPVFSYTTSATNTIYYGATVPCGVNGLACFRRTVPDAFGMWFRPNGHRFDWGTLRWCELSGAPDGCFDAENVALDELGHVLGLDHHVNYSDDTDYRDAVVQTVTRAKPRAGYNAHVYGRCDVARLQVMYDVATSSTLYSTCLDVPTVLTMSASTTSVVSGSMVTFSAKLMSAGSGKFSNNSVSNRTVVLQQRSGTGWADVMTMTPGSSGTYTASLTVRATQDYRALFRTPSNEGLNGDSSPAVSITVTSTCTGTLCPQSVQVQ